MNIATMCRMCGQNKNVMGFNDDGECADCVDRINKRAKRLIRMDNVGGIADMDNALRAMCPGQYSGLTINYNDHNLNYYTVAQCVEAGDYHEQDWVDEHEKKRAIEKNQVWEIQWYPNTPIGFHKVIASSLEKAFDGARFISEKLAKEKR